MLQSLSTPSFSLPSALVEFLANPLILGHLLSNQVYLALKYEISGKRIATLRKRNYSGALLRTVLISRICPKNPVEANVCPAVK